MIASAVLAFLASAAVQGEPPAAAAPAAPAAAVKEKKICRSEEVTGSIMLSSDNVSNTAGQDRSASSTTVDLSLTSTPVSV